ncbi:MAG: hypothetical protein QGF24_10480 [Dehalococcoidia bacterium]|nr:hypothetical protein [Dehalococcoidia bacterium]
MNTATGEIFVKMSDVWVASGNVTGPAGSDGAAGPGTTITEFSYTITAADEATVQGVGELVITNAFFETGVRIDIWMHFPSTFLLDPVWANSSTPLQSGAGAAYFFDGSVLLYHDEIGEGVVLTFYKFEPTT